METPPTNPDPRPQPVAPSRKRRAKFYLGGSAVVFVLVGLVVWAMARPGSTSFYMTTTELAASGTTGSASDQFRVNGRVVPGSIRTDGLDTTFTISDGTTDMTVATDRPLPDTFRDRSEIVARGHMAGDTFVASEVLAKCPSKFKARA